jgi:OOP family OmpA-OmpF porin
MRTSIKTRCIRTSGVVAFLALIGAAHQPAAAAEPVSGFYIGAGAGGNYIQDEPISSVQGFTTTRSNLATDIGGVGVLSGGYAWSSGVRAELEGDYRYNGTRSISGTGSTGAVHTGNSGSEQKYGPMVNFYYDFNGLSASIVPYVGLGAGYQFVQEQMHIDGAAKSKAEGAVAGQAILGVAFPIDSVPGLEVTAEYRFMYVGGNRNYNATTASHSTIGVTLGNDFNHAVMLGVRYGFGTTPAPVPARVAPAPMLAAVPAPQPARKFLVFFDWDKTELTEHARQIVYDAALGASKVRSTQITVNGFTDTSGSGQYNQALSVRRARTVADELVRDGVPASVISIQGFGESNPLVPTANGVREPQNRRVEIVIR